MYVSFFLFFISVPLHFCIKRVHYCMMADVVCNQKLLTGLVSCRCVAIDFRGHGDTKTNNDEDLSAETMARYMCMCVCG